MLYYKSILNDYLTNDRSILNDCRSLTDRSSLADDRFIYSTYPVLSVDYDASLLFPLAFKTIQWSTDLKSYDLVLFQQDIGEFKKGHVQTLSSGSALLYSLMEH